MEKEKELKKLEGKITADKKLPLQESNLVFGEGSPEAKVMFIGEAPGERENALGRPFVGRAGKLLDHLLAEINWERGSVYITNIVKRRPPMNRDPLPEEIAAYKPYLAEQIEIIDPLIIATLGRFSMNYFLPEAKMTKDEGKLFKINGRFIYPLFHPAAALRSPQTMGEALRKSFMRLPAVLKKCEGIKKKSGK